MFTPHTVISFTLSKHMLGSTFLNFHRGSFFHTYTLHTCFSVHSPYSYFVYTLQALSTHVLVFTPHTVISFNIFKFSPGFIFSYFHSPHMFQCSLSIQVFGLLSQHMLGSKFFDFQGITFSSYLHSPHMFLHAVVFSTLQKSFFFFFFFVPCLLCTHV